MSYTPTNWQTGDTVTAEKLNNMETGIEVAVETFIVTCTPTALDYSGTMDKTVAEIYAAYQAGQKIVFRVLMGADEYLDATVTMKYANEIYQYPFFIALVFDETNNLLIAAATGLTDDGTKNTYSTRIYSLAPAS